jgi:hypothetical protein
MSTVYSLDLDTWTPPVAADSGRGLAQMLEAGHVLHLPRLAADVREDERRFLDARWLDPRSKNISIEDDAARIKGVVGTEVEQEGLRELVVRYRACACGLIARLFPAYVPELRAGRTSFRPARADGRVTSWRKDDTRLHVDSFPSRPNRGERILRVFANVSPAGEPRVWRIGEPFEQLAVRMLPRIRRPIPGAAWMLHALRVTKTRRSEYDHFMLHLHDEMKRDLAYQRDVHQATVRFGAPSVWICFSDQTSHAAVSGQFMLEQTLHIPVGAMYDPASSPLRILERLAGRMLA